MIPSCHVLLDMLYLRIKSSNYFLLWSNQFKDFWYNKTIFEKCRTFLSIIVCTIQKQKNKPVEKLFRQIDSRRDGPRQTGRAKSPYPEIYFSEYSVQIACFCQMYLALLKE